MRREQSVGWHFRNRPAGLIAIILYKGLWGIVETMVGLVLVYAPRLVARELLEDPQDLFLNWIISHAHPDFAKAPYIGIVIMALGIGKIIIAIGLWYRSWVMRNVGMVALSIFALYAIWEMIQMFTAFRFIAFVADVAILLYFWKILPRHLKHHGELV